MAKDKTFLEWDVKPVFTVDYPSEATGNDSQGSFQVFGLESASGELMRNYEYINSVEQHLQGYKKMASELTITLVVKEQGGAFEKLRRLGKSGTLFDVSCNLVKNITSSEHRGGSHENAPEWMDGFEQWIGCIINRESQTIEIGDIPVREFECMALSHRIKTADNYNTASVDEGDGVPPSLSDVMG